MNKPTERLERLLADYAATPGVFVVLTPLATATQICGSCDHRTGAGSCRLDVLDPQGREIVGVDILNWWNRRTFGCHAHTPKDPLLATAAVVIAAPAPAGDGHALDGPRIKGPLDAEYDIALAIIAQQREEIERLTARIRRLDA